jgi:hypothetical protein
MISTVVAGILPRVFVVPARIAGAGALPERDHRSHHKKDRTQNTSSHHYTSLKVE